VVWWGTVNASLTLQSHIHNTVAKVLIFESGRPHVSIPLVLQASSTRTGEKRVTTPFCQRDHTLQPIASALLCLQRLSARSAQVTYPPRSYPPNAKRRIAAIIHQKKHLCQTRTGRRKDKLQLAFQLHRGVWGFAAKCCRWRENSIRRRMKVY